MTCCVVNFDRGDNDYVVLFFVLKANFTTKKHSLDFTKFKDEMCSFDKYLFDRKWASLQRIYEEFTKNHDLSKSANSDGFG